MLYLRKKNNALSGTSFEMINRTSTVSHGICFTVIVKIFSPNSEDTTIINVRYSPQTSIVVYICLSHW